MKLWGVLLIDALLYVVLMAVVCNPSWKKYYIPAKCANSLGFVAMLFLGMAVSGDAHQFWRMLPGFFCCFAGDIFMACYNLWRRKIHFLMGVATFLAAHICLVRWLCIRQPLRLEDLLFPAIAVLLIFGMTASKKIHTGRLRPFIIVYAFFVALLFSKGVHVLHMEMTVPACMIASGTALFLVSDISILFLYFYRGKNKAVHIFNLTAYYAAMYLLAGHLFAL